MARVFRFSKALSDKNRVKILQMLTEGDKNVTSVADKLNVEENLASHHLRVLFTLGLLKSTKKGRQVFYGLNTSKITGLFRDLRKNPIFKEILLDSLKDE